MINKRTRANKNIGIIILLILGILLVGNLNLFTIGLGSSKSSEEILISQDFNSATYRFTINRGFLEGGLVSSNTQEITWDQEYKTSNFQLNTLGTALPIFVEGIQENVFFETSDVTISPNIEARWNNDESTLFSVNIIESKAECKVIKSDTVANDPQVIGKAVLTCRFFGSAEFETTRTDNPKANWYGFETLSAKVKILKVGVEKIIVFRKIGITCTEMEILNTETLSTDFSSMEFCEASIDDGNGNGNGDDGTDDGDGFGLTQILLILGAIGMLGLLTWVAFKK